MRQIEFRGKRIKDGKWIFGNLADYSMKVFNTTIEKKIIFGNILNFSTDNFGFVVDDCAVDPDTIGQFTGLSDKNGKEIYEDDRVNVVQAERNFDIVVKWSNEAMAFMACYADGKQSPFSWFTNLRIYQLTVIGSIHDNPELISKKQ